LIRDSTQIQLLTGLVCSVEVALFIGYHVQPMTLTEKILARAAGKPRVQAGDNIWVSADVLMTHDVCGPGTIGVFKREFGKTAKVWTKTNRHHPRPLHFHRRLTLKPQRGHSPRFCARTGHPVFLRCD